MPDNSFEAVLPDIEIKTSLFEVSLNMKVIQAGKGDLKIGVAPLSCPKAQVWDRVAVSIQKPIKPFDFKSVQYMNPTFDMNSIYNRDYRPPGAQKLFKQEIRQAY
ncbi:MAG TPA: hypothetical protein V6D17_08810 [Candidatus Obscuribacterales bacterium]